MLLIIFGTRPRAKTIDSGKFFCPHCQQERKYELKTAKNYFTLYFVPLIPLNDVGEYVECQTCQNNFHTDVLKLDMKPKKAPLDLSAQLNTLPQRLQDGLPIEYAVRDLTVAGLSREVALSNVMNAAGGERNTCPQCGLSYAPSVQTCAEDGSALQPA